MSGSATVKEGTYNYTATVAEEQNLDSPVVVTSGAYRVQFDGNDFATKHLRRIRRNSVTELQKGDASGKIAGYLKEANGKAWERFAGKSQATSTLIFLDLEQFCQFGIQVIRFLSADNTAWTPYPPPAPNCLQRHAVITIGKCFASSNDGFGHIKPNQGVPDRLQHGIGVTVTVTVKQPLNGNGKNIQVCHYAQGAVQNQFAPETLSGGFTKVRSIGQSIVST